MIICVSGLIASGKTTFALNNMNDDDEIIDWDKIVKEFNVEDNVIAQQITLDLLEDAIESDKVTWFVTTIPDKHQQEILDRCEDVKYIWLHTDIPTTINNIKHRNRYNEVVNIDNLMIKNVDILKRSDKYIMKYNAKLINNY